MSLHLRLHSFYLFIGLAAIKVGESESSESTEPEELAATRCTGATGKASRSIESLSDLIRFDKIWL